MPQGGGGAALVTSRDPTIAFGIAAATFHVEPFETAEAASAFLTMVGRNSTSDSEHASAVSIVEALGGLPLAISQISGFIVQQKLALSDFLPFYERNAAKINKRKLNRGEDEHTLSTVWEVTLAKLPQSSATLQNLLAFFDPDNIHESVLTEGGPHVDDTEFEFLQDEMEYVIKQCWYLEFILMLIVLWMPKNHY